jgi:hypothetical protein
MADDFYADGAVETTETASPSARDDMEESESQTALLPQSLCPGMEPGDVIKVRIVEVTEQDYMVEYVEADEDKEEVEETETETVTSGMSEMME